MKFTKMHGIGNDYIYVDCLREPLANPGEVAKFVSDRHFGIGGDGLVLICPSDEADFEMRMYNADGSEGEMCGNAIRCVAKYVYDRGLTSKKDLSIHTLAGNKHLEITEEGGKAVLVRVDMGAPELEAAKIPVLMEGEEGQARGRAVDAPIEVAGKGYRMTCVSMGNPHCVIFMDEDVGGLPLADIGPSFENHPRFPKRINTEFVNVAGRRSLRMRVWERGSGETMACGTGACAAVVAAILTGRIEEEARVSLPGGELSISWEGGDAPVYMTGPAATVFDGEIVLPPGL